MSLILKDRVQETSLTTGTGTLTLSGAVASFQTFSSAIGNGNTTYYTILAQGGTDWEVGIGTVGAGTLARTTILASSNGGSVVNLTGASYVWGDYPANKAMFIDENNKVRADGNSYLDFASASPALIAGRMWYDNAIGSWNLGMGGGNITQQVGEEFFVYGKASTAITDNPLKIVYRTGTVGASGVVTFAPTVAGITNGDLILGCATENIALNGFGRITSNGVINGIATNGSAYGETWVDGDEIWYNPLTGNPTKVKPLAPNIKVLVGIIINAGSGGSGSFYVEINHGSVLGGTDSNVQLTTPLAGQILTYDATNAYWKNTTLGAGTGISVASTAGGVTTVTNSAPDQTVALTAGTAISISGTYPSFTINNTGVTSLAGTASQVTVSASTGSVTLSLPATINVNTSGNAATATNGVVTTGSYADPTWITSLAGSKITGTIDGGSF